MISNFITSRKHGFYIFTTDSIAFFSVVSKLFYDTNAPLRSAQLRPGPFVDALLTSSVASLCLLACLSKWLLVVLGQNGSRDGCWVNSKFARVSAESQF